MPIMANVLFGPESIPGNTLKDALPARTVPASMLTLTQYVPAFFSTLGKKHPTVALSRVHFA